MTDKAISPLRRRLIEDMAIRRLSPKTQLHYIRHVKRFADFLGRSADKATARRFLIHVLPDRFHRIRHYGLFANANRAANIALARRLLGAPDPAPTTEETGGAEGGHADEEWNTCPCCGGRMVIVEIFEPGCQPRLWPVPAIGLDSS